MNKSLKAYCEVCFVCVFLALMIPPALSVASNADKKIYVSTAGMSFFVKNNNNDLNSNFSLYRIESESDKDIILSYLLGVVDKNSGNEVVYSLLHRLLGVRDYERERVYIVVSPSFAGIKIKQPYFYKGEGELVFEVVHDQLEKAHQLYIRSYIVDINKDKFKKVIDFNGEQHILHEKGLMELK